MGGLMSITGERDGQPGAGPQKVGIAITDVLTGMYASVGILAALTHRERTGEGQYIDCALLDTIVAFNANQIVSYFCSGRIPDPLRQCARAGRAVRSLPDCRRPHHPCHRQRRPVQALLRDRRMPRSSPRRRASRPTRSASCHRAELIR
jgi:crotonobetainyl-CoA:carnitine CoA-transferase CaiB-like acyl-CoA transferase